MDELGLWRAQVPVKHPLRLSRFDSDLVHSNRPDQGHNHEGDPMRVMEVRRVFDGAVHGRQDVVMEINLAQATELRRALAVVDLYRMAARKAAAHDEGDADFTSYTYAVKNDRVVVGIECGAIG